MTQEDFVKEMAKQGLKPTKGLVCGNCGSKKGVCLDKDLTFGEPACWDCLWGWEVEAMEDSL